MSTSDPALRARLLEILTRLTKQYPQLRVGQILGNATVGDLYYMTDAELAKSLAALDDQYRQLAAARVRKEQLT